MNEVACEILRTQLVEANSLINQSINLELSYINTNHPDFIGLGLLLNRHNTEGLLRLFIFFTCYRYILRFFAQLIYLSIFLHFLISIRYQLYQL